MVFGGHALKKIMPSRNSTSTLLIVLAIILTFPIWIGIAGGIFGVIAATFGVVFGIIGAVFGAVFGAIGGVFGHLFDWDWHFGFFHWNIFPILLLIVVVALISRQRKVRR
jgi:uncharacterized membrane protein